MTFLVFILVIQIGKEQNTFKIVGVIIMVTLIVFLLLEIISNLDDTLGIFRYFAEKRKFLKERFAGRNLRKLGDSQFEVFGKED
mmetsp:Transcript_17084/g.14968  ORF Transcript_17084/g.14968 Transcript_17084/m.14968 type:complete len:84 (+) Transcript_17084:198-449(+)